MVASTNHLDQLDPGLSSRPSRFDRKYLFPLPSEEERDLYCQYWRIRLQKKNVDVEFPRKICPAMALITDGFSFAYLQEAFVATLLAIALKRSDPDDDEVDRVKGGGDDGDKDLNEYELWRELKKTIKSLRDDMNTKPDKDKSVAQSNDEVLRAMELEKEAQASSPSSEGQPDQASFPLRPATGALSENLGGLHRKEDLFVDHQGLPFITEGTKGNRSCFGIPGLFRAEEESSNE